MHQRTRKLLFGTFLSLCLTHGCQSPLWLGAKPPKVTVNHGSMDVSAEADLAIQVDFRSLMGVGYSVQAATGFAKLVAKVTGPNIVGELLAEVSAIDCPSGVATLSFSELPPGPVDVVVNAYEQAGNVLVWAKESGVSIVGGKTVVLEMTCRAADGSLIIDFKCPQLCVTDCPEVSSDFENGTKDDWSAIGDGGQGTLVATGGNPGGYLHLSDGGAGMYYYFTAPAKYLGDKSCYYGGSLSFDLRATHPESQNKPNVILKSGSRTINYLPKFVPSTSWQRFQVNLVEEDWTFGSPPKPVTRDELISMLSALDAIEILGEFSSRGGIYDQAGLDNVNFGPLR